MTTSTPQSDTMIQLLYTVPPVVGTSDYPIINNSFVLNNGRKMKV